MKTNLSHKMISLLTFVMLASACNDFEPQQVPYEEPDPVEEPVTPPTINPDWDLEMILNIGQHDKNVFVYKDKKYDKLFTRTLGWNGGDGVFTTGLPDGNVFWSFNDSFYGVVEGDTRTRRDCSFPRNSLMIQKAGADGRPGETDEDLVWLADYVQTDNPDADRYYQARTHIRHPQASLSEADIQRGDIDQDYIYWAGDGTVYDDPVRGKVFQMTWGAVDLTQGNGSMIRFGTCFAEYSLEGTPGDGQYMKMLTRNDDFNDDTIGYGSTLFEDEDGHIYLYTTEAEGFSSNTLVARTETLDLGSTWYYYIRDVNGVFNWQTEFPTAEERARSYIQTSPAALPWVFKDGETYYMVAQSYPYGRAVKIFRSDKPYGPFTDEKVLFTLPNTLDKIGNQYFQHLYMINLHPALSREGELVFSTNSDTFSFWDNFNRPGSADFYRPFFYRVFNWKSLYEEEE